MKILIIQTAFIGDVVLATPLVEKLKQFHPDATIDFLVRKGNEKLLANNRHLRQVLVFDKKQGKYRNAFSLIRQFRGERYDLVVNVQRFFTTGLITVLSGARRTVGFDKNPLSFWFSKAIKHSYDGSSAEHHEVKRNLKLIADITDDRMIRPRIYPSAVDFEKVSTDQSYVTMAPASVWFTKQFPEHKWVELISKIPAHLKIFLLGGPGDAELCQRIAAQTTHPGIDILAGKLSFLESAALMKGAVMNYVNDSGPMHFASAVNAPVTAFYCSTIPGFGFGPLSDQSFIAEIDFKLDCRPCGIHGYKACPKGHFKCSEIEVDKVVVF
ncbi:MAG: glycosyltransferase family 9 protein [Bacteroidota bacterium]